MKTKNPVLSNGLAMFSMFFGAGNIIFPLMVGKIVQGDLFLALAGLIIGAVFIPFSGMMATTLFDGDYKSFFSRIGKKPAMIAIVLILALIGPFGALPRCVTLTFSTLHVYFPSLNQSYFSLGACLLIFLCCFRKSRIVSIIGLVLTPILLISLGAIIVKGIFFSPGITGTGSVSEPFSYGLKIGYNTMDLLATFFFSSLICAQLRSQLGDVGPKGLVKPFLKACAIGAGLLTLVYVGFSYVAASYSEQLAEVPLDQLLGRIGHIVLGEGAGLFVSLAVAMACLTTAIALTVVCAEFLQTEITRGKVGYEQCQALILLVAFLGCTLGFNKIVAILGPVLHVLYPAILALNVVNILYKLYDFKPVKTPVYAVLTLVIILLIASHIA